jgi:lysophospholipase L1-like esterase
VTSGFRFLRSRACVFVGLLALAASCAKSPAAPSPSPAAPFPPPVPPPALAPPTIQVTTFMAFGDSLTEGEWWPGLPQLQTYDPTKSYPTWLLQMLQARYTTQQFVVSNKGLGGSEAAKDEQRFSDALRMHSPQVVLLLEGVNDLFKNQNDTGIENLAHALRNDIRNARAAGAYVFLSTLTAERPATTDICAPECRDQAYFVDNPQLLAAANAAIRNLAITESGVTLVDGYAITAANPDLYVGADGLHLSIEGYQALAAGFFEAIKTKYENPAPPAPTWSGGPSISAISPHVEVRSQRSR